MLHKEHLTEKGLRQIVAIKSALNLGLSPKLKSAFSDVLPKIRPLVETKPIEDPCELIGRIH